MEQRRAPQVSLEDFIEVATAAALRAVESSKLEESALNPQPLPPRLRPGLIIGIIIDPTILRQVGGETQQ
jgi:hypothetical protein